SLVLKANGSAGLGTASPTAHLEIAGSGQDYLLAGAGAGAGGGAMFRLASDGNGSCDGAWSGGGADYAEWFEWQDGNPLHEDRRGLSVVLEGARIRPARADEDPIGVISAAPAVIGDGDMGYWKGRWQRDALARCCATPKQSHCRIPPMTQTAPISRAAPALSGIWSG
ncbi:peptidase G2 autoproteolytic cleavage domain-containing protein, partial [Pseudophaeobacter leonis]|uniref:peptidase G2 autoproteolytic cleavage domain-containing protein n=1 Tax=Pseudophaeobacter leonis TaxID=1144477 RepID=UPI00240A8C29